MAILVLGVVIALLVRIIANICFEILVALGLALLLYAGYFFSDKY
jgi:hypothetical protein